MNIAANKAREAASAIPTPDEVEANLRLQIDDLKRKESAYHEMLRQKDARIAELTELNNNQAAMIDGLKDVRKGLERALEKRHAKQRKVTKENKNLHHRLNGQRWKTDHALYCLQRMVEIGYHLWETTGVEEV